MASPHKILSFLATFLVVVCGVAACSSGAAEPAPTTVTATDVTVTGTGDEAPKLIYDSPFVFVEPRSEVLWEGSGDPVEDGQWVLLRFYAEDPDTKDVVRNDFLEVPVALKVSRETLGSELYDLVVGKPEGSRFLQITNDGDTTNIVVVDMLAAHSTGAARSQEAHSATVTYGQQGEPIISIGEDAKKPTTLEVQQIRSGSSEQVEEGSQVVIQFVAASWKTGKQFDSTWTEDTGPVTVRVGADKIIAGLDEALVGAPIGSQLLVTIPPELGFANTDSKYAKSTLVYVVDVLAASAAKQ